MAAAQPSDEGPWMLVLGALALACGMGFLLWIGYTAQIVRGGVVAYHYANYAWNWIPLDIVQGYDSDLERRFRIAYGMGADAPFVSWMHLSADVFRPFAYLSLPAVAYSLGIIWFGAKLDLRRRFKGDDLIEEIMKTFSGVAPVAKLSLINNDDPLWRPQMWPEELVKAHGLAMDNVVVAERARKFYVKTLGPRVVDLQALKGKNPKEVCFADRMTPQGKTIFAILCAFAFGGEEGRLECRKVLDALNYSAYGSAHGEANLALANDLYQKYRMQPQAHALFRVHHYENTYLYEIFNRAKRWGKINTSHYRWLRPMDRYKFLGLNTVKRFVPHPESAAIFNLHAFERACFRQKRIPKAPDEHHLTAKYPVPGFPYVEDAVASLGIEYAAWQKRSDTDEDEKIWNREDLWTIKNPAYNVPPAAVPPMAAGPATSFDLQMMEQERAAQARREAQLKDEINAIDSNQS
jgi:hypothetical protein